MEPIDERIEAICRHATADNWRRLIELARQAPRPPDADWPEGIQDSAGRTRVLADLLRQGTDAARMLLDSLARPDPYESRASLDIEFRGITVLADTLEARAQTSTEHAMVDLLRDAAVAASLVFGHGGCVPEDQGGWDAKLHARAMDLDIDPLANLFAEASTLARGGPSATATSIRDGS
jgi:hypothetical protein